MVCPLVCPQETPLGLQHSQLLKAGLDQYLGTVGGILWPCFSDSLVLRNQWWTLWAGRRDSGAPYLPDPGAPLLALSPEMGGR